MFEALLQPKPLCSCFCRLLMAVLRWLVGTQLAAGEAPTSHAGQNGACIHMQSQQWPIGLHSIEIQQPEDVAQS